MAKFKEMVTDQGSFVFAGKSAKNNEELVEQVGKNELVFHTAGPGSPFVNIKGKARRGDIKEAAIFCAKHSKDWRDTRLDVKVHKFKGKHIYKDKSMKLGTFGVKKFKIVRVKKEWIEEFKE
ncbi:unnamed protein product [marine sediment metagenome]|uniref:NFACT RNA-binding domain-containing protein n=1 Tax=marine sediment metagenome TaxID=412755 RepID=X0YGG1_9ZZZZ